MTAPLNAKNTPFSWSFTALADYEGCAARYAASRFYCTVPFQESAASIWGSRVHKAGELFLKGIPHKDEEALLPVEPYCTAILRTGHKVEAEVEVTLTRGMAPTSWFAKDAWFRAKLDVVVTKVKENSVSLLDWKGLDVRTKIPTPTGWTTMAALQEGDTIFGGDGSPCKVIGKSPTFNRKCFEIVFKDGAKVICDDQHLWVSKKCGMPLSLAVRSTAEIAEIVASGKGVSMPVGGAVKYAPSKTPLKVHPYVLGCWLGDGCRARGEICKPNTDMFDAIAQCGYMVSHNIASESKCDTRTIYGLTRDLRNLGVLQNKHIPAEYLTATYAERLALLRGLLDTDGTWNFIRSQVVFTTVDKEFALQVVELLASLGQKPYFVELNKFGFGKALIGYDVIFTPNNIKPFLTYPRAADVAVRVSESAMYTKRYIKTIMEVDSVPTQCIAVDSPRKTYLCTDRFIVTHNTGGKIKDAPDQLRLCAAALAVVRPYLQEFTGKYIWTQHKQVTGIEPINKTDIPKIWQEFLPRVARMEEAWRTENFPARPSGLCPWCAVEPCPQRRGERRV